MSLPGPPGQGYDYITALTNLRDKIAELSIVQQQQRGSGSRLSAGLQFWRRNRSNVFVVFTMYAMSTASVISAVMADSRLQVGRRDRQQITQHAACKALAARSFWKAQEYYVYVSDSMLMYFVLMHSL
jgi:hypothetical protein